MSLTEMEQKKEKQLDLIKSICKKCFNNNVRDGIRVNDEHTFRLTITKPNDTLLISDLLFNLENTTIRDVRFSKVNAPLTGIHLLFSTMNMLAIGETQYARINRRKNLPFTPPHVTNISPQVPAISETDKVWIESTNEYLMRNFPIAIEHPIVAYRDMKDLCLTTWLDGGLTDCLTLKDFRNCMSLEGVKDIELSVENGEMRIKVYCGIEKPSAFKKKKEVAHPTGQDVLPSKPHVRRIFGEERYPKRQRQDGNNHIEKEERKETASVATSDFNSVLNSDGELSDSSSV